MSNERLSRDDYFLILNTIIENYPFPQVYIPQKTRKPKTIDYPPKFYAKIWEKWISEYSIDGGMDMNGAFASPTAELFLINNEIVTVSEVYQTMDKVLDSDIHSLFTHIVRDLLSVQDVSISDDVSIPAARTIASDIRRRLQELNREFISVDWFYDSISLRRPYVKKRVLYQNAWNNFYVFRDEYDVNDLNKIFSVFDNLQSEAERDWLLNALAYKIQNPKNKGQFIVFYGKQGTGKSALAELCGRILGGYESVSENILNSRFTSWLYTGKLLTVINEYYFTKANINAFKDIITNENVIIEEKNKNPYYGKHYSWFILTTNNISNLRLFERSDRISLLTSFNRRIRYTDNEQNLANWISDEEIEKFRAYLFSLKPQKVTPFSYEIQKYSEEMLVTPVISWLMRRLDEDLHNYMVKTVERTEEGIFIAVKWVENTMKAMVSEGFLGKDIKSFGAFKREFLEFLNFALPGTKKVEFTRYRFNKSRKRAWFIPIQSLSELTVQNDDDDDESEEEKESTSQNISAEDIPF